MGKEPWTAPSKLVFLERGEELHGETSPFTTNLRFYGSRPRRERARAVYVTLNKNALPVRRVRVQFRGGKKGGRLHEGATYQGERTSSEEARAAHCVLTRRRGENSIGGGSRASQNVGEASRQSGEWPATSEWPEGGR